MVVKKPHWLFSSSGSKTSMICTMAPSKCLPFSPAMYSLSMKQTWHNHLCHQCWWWIIQACFALPSLDGGWDTGHDILRTKQFLHLNRCNFKLRQLSQGKIPSKTIWSMINLVLLHNECSKCRCWVGSFVVNMNHSTTSQRR